MRYLYSIEPDLCITSPELLVNFTKDIFLPLYFYQQLLHLSKHEIPRASSAAREIINALTPKVDGLLFFHNPFQGNIYFIDEKNNIGDSEDFNIITFDPQRPLDRYILSLSKASQVLNAHVFFYFHSTNFLHKCRAVNFSPANKSEFTSVGHTWLTHEMTKLFNKGNKPTSQIYWKDEEKVNSPKNRIEWLDII